MDDEIWKIDMWSAHEDYDLPRSEHLVEPMKRILTPTTRAIILRLKERRQVNSALDCPSIHLYRAVLEDGVQTEEELHQWIHAHPQTGLTAWCPSLS